MKHFVSRIDDIEKASEIIQGVDFLKCMRWVDQPFEQITKNTIKHCFKKYGFLEVSLLAEEPDKEFEDLVQSLTINLILGEYASFDNNADTLEIPINMHM